MKRKYYLLIVIAGLIAISAAIIVYAVSSRTKIRDRFEVGNGGFRIQVTVYDERSSYAPPGARIVFESSPTGSETWHHVLTYLSDQPIPSPRNQIRFVGDQIAYFFVGNYYAVTIDGGGSWFVWDANKELPVDHFMQQFNLWPAIEQLELQSNGQGRMTLYRYLSKKERGPTLITSDFGRHWSIDPEPTTK